MQLTNITRVLGILVALNLGVALHANAAPSPEDVDAYLNHYVSLTLESGERFNAAIYTRSEGHIVLKHDDGRVESLAIRKITAIEPPYTDEDVDADNAAFEIEQDAYIEHRDETHDHADEAQADNTPNASDDEPTDEDAADDTPTDEHLADATQDDDIDAETDAAEDAQAHAADDAPNDDLTDDDAADEDATEAIDTSYTFNALDRRVLDEELRSLMHKQELQREVDRTARGLVIGGSTVIGVHVAIQGLLLIPLFSKDGSMSSRTAKVLSGVNLPFILMGGSLLAAGLVQRDRARKEFQERYNFSVAPTFYKDGAGAQMRLNF